MIASFPTPPHKEERSEQDIRLVIRDEVSQLRERRFKNACTLIGTIGSVIVALVAVAEHLPR